MSSTLRFSLALCILFFLLNTDFHAQQVLYTSEHRPAGLNWQELHSPHFRIIFASGHEDIARRAARILESQYYKTLELTGGKLKRFPVVLSPYNDVTNGFVSSINFRSEVDLSPFKGKALNPQSGSWLETVLLHELLHANHANVSNPFSFATLLGLLGPDYRRSFNFFPPVGVHEGLAVYHESEHGIRDYSGRSNYTYFQNQFNANLVGAHPWNTGQLFIPSEYTEPGNRHYIGGAAFTTWLHDTYGNDVSKRAIRVHQNLFFLGYGYALKYVTGKWPKQLYEEFNDWQHAQEHVRIKNNDLSTDRLHRVITSPFDGVQQQRPLWISNNEILYFSRQYNAPGAFYTYDQTTDTHALLSEHYLVDDAYIDYEKESGHLFIGEYFSLNRIISNYQAELVRLNIDTGTEFRILAGRRLYAPDKQGSNFYALQPNGDVSNIVKVLSDSVVTLTDFKDRSAVVVKASPHKNGELAVIINQRGVQALWIVNESSLQYDLKQAPTLAFKDGSIHDPVWHPKENKLLFTMDAFPAMNIYEYDLETERVVQLTNSEFNAMDASYHPEDGSIVYVTQVENERKIALLSKDDFYNRELSEDELLTGSQLDEAMTAPFLGDELLSESETWEVSDYGRDFRWLKPRAILPIINDQNGRTEWGASIQSTDVLQSQVYSFQITTLQDQLWYDLKYTNKTFYPGISISTYREPSILPIRFTDDTPQGTFVINSLAEELGARISIPFEYYFDDVDRFSSFFIRPNISYNKLQYNTLQGEAISNSTIEWKGGIYTQLNIRLLQNSRDIQPSSGFQLFLQADRGLNDTELQFSTDEFRTALQPLEKRSANYFGAHGYVSPFPKTNQSLKLTAQWLSQSDRAFYSNSTIIPFGFNDDLFFDSSTIGRFSTKYAVPISYPDNGGLLVPFYVSTIYLTLFSHTLLDYDDPAPYSTAQSLIGTGLHVRFKISNLALDLGVGVAYNINSNSAEFILGSF